LPVSAEDHAVHAQACQLDDAFKAIGRRVLVDHDPAGEMPLRQLRVCMALYEGPRSMSELSRELGVSQSAITQLADRLEHAKMVTRGSLDDDRRMRTLQLTPRARKMLRLREQNRVGRVMVILKRMSALERNAVLAAMACLRDASNNDV
jgi:DNA-binding MarR family transcriptional regulator